MCCDIRGGSDWWMTVRKYRVMEGIVVTSGWGGVGWMALCTCIRVRMCAQSTKLCNNNDLEEGMKLT